MCRDLLGIRSLIVQVSCLENAFVCSNRNFISFLHLSLFKLHLVSDINMVGGRGRASGKSQRGRQLVSRRSEAGFATESYQAIPANPAPVLQRIVDELPEDPHQQQVY
ncbi:Uncharacterized protein APZ42_026178 [Daphnia magna]|uniref:Uncharacterized protein n=1 Tax=Daphnia magna TaxID=35525 RepID=A0A164SFB0_9CRUS|nr:Uncharacterized protein APZ42_026178 [Daphnia magna]